jgi:3-phosphoshikimate 1-carboxyvinyltransferase
MEITPASSMTGRVALSGDKSIAHRALMLGALANGTTRVANVPSSDDLAATRRCLESLGVPIERNGGGALYVRGGALGEAAAPLACGGSGTTIRLIAGLLAGQSFTTILAANAQLARRPMQRIIDPLRLMGADVSALTRGEIGSSANGHNDHIPMLVIRGGGLHAINYQTPVPSAQIKSSILLASLNADGVTTVSESAPTRDHTERMLRAMGVPVSGRDERDGRRVISLSPAPLNAVNITVPNDFSSAAFFIVAALLTPNAELIIPSVNLNPTRTGLLNIITLMGGQVAVENPRDENGEPVGDLHIRTVSGLHGATIGGALVPRAIDEFPLVALLATQAEGETLVCDAAELRVKESDRVASVVEELRKMGATLEERPDGFVVQGPTRLRGARVDSHGDHRLAMTLAVAGLIASGATRIDGSESVSKSFPDFEKVLKGLVA